MYFAAVFLVTLTASVLLGVLPMFVSMVILGIFWLLVLATKAL